MVLTLDSVLSVSVLTQTWLRRSVLPTLKCHTVCYRRWLKAWWGAQRQYVHGWFSDQVCASVYQSVCPKEAGRHTRSWEAVWWRTQGRSSTTDCGNNTYIRQRHFCLFNEPHLFCTITLETVWSNRPLRRRKKMHLWKYFYSRRSRIME